jgi:hypothetical protein
MSSIIQNIKYEIYSQNINIKPYNIYLDDNEINNLCYYTKFTKKEVTNMEILFSKNQIKGIINDRQFISLIKIIIPTKTVFYKNLLYYFDINDNIDIIKFILIMSVMLKKSNFLDIEKIIFEIIDIENEGIITIPKIKNAFITNNIKYDNKKIFTVVIKNEIFKISLKLFVDILIQELFIDIEYPKLYNTYNDFILQFNTTPYYKIILQMFIFTNN